MKSTETVSNNPDLQDALLSKCTVPPPERIAIISEAIGEMPDSPMILPEIDQMVERIFSMCNGENGRPKIAEETGSIIVDIRNMLASRVKKEASVTVPRLKGGGSISGL